MLGALGNPAAMVLPRHHAAAMMVLTMAHNTLAAVPPGRLAVKCTGAALHGPSKQAAQSPQDKSCVLPHYTPWLLQAVTLDSVFAEGRYHACQLLCRVMTSP
jgi:hypothetical protein